MLGPIGAAGRFIKVVSSGLGKLVKSFSPFTKMFLGFAALFGSVSAMASDANDEMVKTKGIMQGVYDNFVDYWFTTDWSVELDVKSQSAEESLEDINDGAVDLLYSLRNVGSTSVLGSLGTDFATFFLLNIERIKGGLNNLAIDFRNWKGQVFADLFDNETFIPEERDFRTAAQKELDKLAPNLYIDFSKIKTVDFEKFADADDLAQVEALQRGVTELASKIQDARDGVGGLFTSDEDLKDGERQLASLTAQLQTYTALIPKTIRAGAKLESLTNQFKNLKTAGDLSEVFGKNALATLEQGKFLSLTAKDASRYNVLMGEAAIISGRVVEILDSDMTDNQIRDALAGLRIELTAVNNEVEELGEIFKVFTSFDVADFIGLDGVDVWRLQNEELEQATAYYKELMSATKDYDRAVAAADTEAAQAAQARIKRAEADGEAFGIAIKDSLMGEIEKMNTAFGQAGISMSTEQFVQLGEEAKLVIQEYGENLKHYQDQLAAAMLDPDITGEDLDALKLSLAEAIVNVGEDVADIVEYELSDNFQRALKPFKDIGAAFSNEDFAKLGMKATQDALVQAEALSQRFEEIKDKDYQTREEMLAAIAQFNEDVIEFEEDLARRRKDAMFNETKAGEMAGNFSELLINAMKGEVDFGKGFATLILDSIQNSLQEQITSFAKGFIETMLGGLDSAESAGNGAAGALKTMIFGPSEKEKEGLESKGADLAGALGLGTPLGTMVDPLYTKVAPDMADLAGTDETLDMLDGMLGVTDGDRSVIESIGGLTDVSKEGFGGLGGLLGNLFGGGAGGGAMGAIGGIASLFGLFDNGGSIQPNKFGIVGERGPELVSGPATVYNRAKTARELENAKGMGGGNVTFALEGDFDSRAERSIRNMVNSGMMQSALNGAEVENGGNQPIFRTP